MTKNASILPRSLNTSRNFSASAVMHWNWGAPLSAPNTSAITRPCFCCGRALGRWPWRNGVRTLFGPASIGLNYRPQSVDLLWRHLRLRHWDTPLASMVRGKQPRKLREELPFAQHLDYKSVNALVRQMGGGRHPAHTF